jgi:superfamily I DNA/RNA helicase
MIDGLRIGRRTVAGESHGEISAKRKAATDAIVNSGSDKRLIIAGPGTGKTFTFRRALEACGDRGLALTFIRNLVADLREALDDIADVFTFHGFCKHQLHKNLPEGLEPDWHYYPPLLGLVADDLARLDHHWTKSSIERAVHTLDETDGSISEALRLASYYNAVSHTDVVYRGLRHFEANRDDLPTYPLIVVDEYQDFSELETAFIELLATESKVLIAGDDDQALYAFKNADARFIRELAEGGEYERFPLPYCSRCTDVVVSAVNAVINAAIDNGNLVGRLDKDFECFVPEKGDDSAAHPLIIHAKCSVQTKASPYVGRYIVEQIQRIPADDIEESHEKGYPTVLVVGPNPFLDAAYAVIEEAFPQAVRRKSDRLGVELLDGYRYLVKDDRSRLGWRIVVECDPFPSAADVLTEVARDETELVDLLPEDYRERHLAVVGLVARLIDDEDELGEPEIEALVAALGLPIEELRIRLNVPDEDEADPEADAEISADLPADEEAVAPSIICTSLISSKGLSAGYVFIVGFNDGHLPRDPKAITDAEVCQFLVGLSRTRKECHVVSVGRLGGDALKRSTFARWIADQTEPLTANKAYFDAA